MVRGLCGLWLSALAAAAEPERCNGIDDDGDGTIDEGPVAWGLDADGDGVGSIAALSLTPSCLNTPTGGTHLVGDCDDGNGLIHPGAIEVCNGVDDDCDGTVDEGGVCLCERFVGVGSTWLACTTGIEWSEALDACHEHGYHLASIPDTETAELLSRVLSAWDQDFWVGLNDRQDEGIFEWEDGTSSDFEDWSDDEPSNGLLGYGILEEDCVELDAGDGGRWNDQPCGAEDAYLCEIECVARAWFPDLDGDGLGDGNAGILACEHPAATVPNAADCDDGDASLPGVFYIDADGDGAPGTPVVACAGDAVPTDCDDADATLQGCDGALSGSELTWGDGALEPPEPPYGFGCSCSGPETGRSAALLALLLLGLRRPRQRSPVVRGAKAPGVCGDQGR
ncbi:MAG TPA: hypothetical protein ENK18_07935 [Deltaproteobacteria bacterium]|nr:hypothetical protein [Deltaproteobacteria bacterium]